ncbi:PA0069 family radical SAM protein [Tistrella bauzanensis]|uniref:PA0069 family radical SAM protein n=1 Tax=Tistrella arctica TaxID=3133430 RepID=A0ABU9YMT5_9PROT
MDPFKPVTTRPGARKAASDRAAAAARMGLAPHRGRGAASNRDGRFERFVHEAVDDGWSGAADATDDVPTVDGDAPTQTTARRPTELRGVVARRPTELRGVVARGALARNDSPDIPFDASINPYRGCEHGCIYCYARPSHAYLGLSPGLDFETIIEVKRGLADALLADLARPGYQPSPITIGGNTDPYQPAEKTERLTRAVIEVLTRHRHPFTIITKSALVLRDIDLLAPAAAAGLAQVAVSVTTLDPVLARAMEPRAATPARRIHAIRGLAAAGIPVTVMAAPMVPGLTDHELEAILAAAADAGAARAGWILLRLPREIAGLFDEWLRLERPDRAERVLARIRATRGGALYDSGFGRRMTGTGTEAALIADRFRLACARLGLNRTSWRLTSALFTPPIRATAAERAGQMDLFGRG